MIWGYLKVAQAPGTAHAQASEGCFTRTWLPVCFPPKRDCFAVALASPTFRVCPQPPACQGLHRKQEVFLHKGAGRQTSGVLVLPGLGSGNLPFLHLSIQHMLKCLYCVPVTVLDTGTL